MSAEPEARVTAEPGAGATGRFAVDAIFAREIAETAGRLQRERYEHVGRIDHKSAKDVVTDVDHLSEDLILGAIRDRFPGDGILAEESGAHRGPAKGRGHGRGDGPARAGRSGTGVGASGDGAAASREGAASTGEGARIR